MLIKEGLLLTKEKDNTTVDDLINRLGYINDDNEKEEIRKTYLFAKKKHIGQFRKSGEEYIIHPLNVAIILTDIYQIVSTNKKIELKQLFYMMF